MELKSYAEMVYFQFYRKVDELDFFIREAVDNALKYKVAPLPKDNIYFDKMQFTFSAYINALVSIWEVAKLSKSLANDLNGNPERDGLVSENRLETDRQFFSDYFECDVEVYGWFCFMKDARNANAHDGSLALNGGDCEHFLFQTDLHRYKKSRQTKRFEYEVSTSPKGNAVFAMLEAAVALVPIFEEKLERPKLSREDHIASAKFKLESITGLLDRFSGREDELINAMVSAQHKGQQVRSCAAHIESWSLTLKQQKILQ